MSARLVTTETVRGSIGANGPLAKGESLVETFSRRHTSQALTTLFAKAFRYVAHGSSINGFRHARMARFGYRGRPAPADTFLSRLRVVSYL